MEGSEAELSLSGPAWAGPREWELEQRVSTATDRPHTCSAAHANMFEANKRWGKPIAPIASHVEFERVTDSQRPATQRSNGPHDAFEPPRPPAVGSIRNPPTTPTGPALWPAVGGAYAARKAAWSKAMGAGRDGTHQRMIQTRPSCQSSCTPRHSSTPFIHRSITARSSALYLGEIWRPGDRRDRYGALLPRTCSSLCCRR